MGKEAGPVLVKLPARLGRPQRRQLRIAEARAHALFPVVYRHVVAFQQAKERRAGEGRARSPRFAGDKTYCLPRGQGQQLGQFLLFEMVKKEIRDRHVGGLTL